jgi:hypothetical protein
VITLGNEVGAHTDTLTWVEITGEDQLDGAAKVTTLLGTWTISVVGTVEGTFSYAITTIVESEATGMAIEDGSDATNEAEMTTGDEIDDGTKTVAGIEIQEVVAT